MTEIITDYLDAKQLADRLTALELHSTSELARLEQERDDALSQIAQAECRAERFCQERDEARIDAQKSKAYKRVLKETNLRQTERIRYLEGATNHACGTPLSVALRERDEARDAFVIATDQMVQAQCKLRESNTERDEARDAILGWENKWKCAIDMAARAELELDELKYSLKIRAINESLRYSKDKNENDNIISKLNSLNPFYKY